MLGDEDHKKWLLWSFPNRGINGILDLARES